MTLPGFLQYGDLGQGFDRSNTFLLQTQCHVWLAQAPCLSCKVAMFGGSFTNCILFHQLVITRVTSVPVLQLTPAPVSACLARKCEQMAAV